MCITRDIPDNGIYRGGFLRFHMGKHVLVPVDDSERSMEAFDYAVQEYGSDTITALTVIDPHHYYATTGLDGASYNTIEQIKSSFEARGKDLLESVESKATEQGVDIETELAFGPVADTIVSQANGLNVDHIVMGSHGRSGASRILLGSVAETVTRRAPVSVTIVR